MAHYRLIVDLPEHVDEETARRVASYIAENGYLDEPDEEVDVDSVAVEKVDD